MYIANLFLTILQLNSYYQIAKTSSSIKLTESEIITELKVVSHTILHYILIKY